jgi:hypothetical protein
MRRAAGSGDQDGCVRHNKAFPAVTAGELEALKMSRGEPGPQRYLSCVFIAEMSRIVFFTVMAWRLSFGTTPANL